MNAYLTLFLLGTGFVLLKRIIFKKKFPPGPRPLPLLGNALQMPTTHQWLKLTEWATQYGDVTYLRIFGQPIAASISSAALPSLIVIGDVQVINSVRVAKLLLDQRAIYSSRPHLVMASELCHFADYFPLAPYGEEWRAQKKMVSFALSKSVIPKYHELQESQARRLTRQLIDEPDDLFPLVKLMIGTIIFRINYGLYPTSFDDPIIKNSLDSLRGFSKASEAGKWLVDFVPFLKYLPRWAPGTGFLEFAESIAKLSAQASWDPYLRCKEDLRNGTSLLPNVCATILSEAPESGLSKSDERLLVYGAASTMGGGLDTSMSVVLSLFLFMSLHPSVQQQAQAEIDKVVGRDRLPSIEDKPDLPYIQSVITEVFRLCPPLPLSLPHSLTQDDVYEGQFLPKDTLILPLVWNMLRDPEAYPNPELFDPSRYNLDTSEMDKVIQINFGWGRRSCPGVHLAEGTVFAIVSTVLATCNVMPILGSDGEPATKEVKLTTGTIVMPEEYRCKFEPRSSLALELLDQPGIRT
ncbi:putative monooxygenase [Mycena floridula]|nr:putative monooxygenase [Mycena floridula]